VKTGFLVVVQIETLILVYLLISTIAELTTVFTIGDTHLWEAFSQLLSTYLSTTVSSNRILCWLKSSYRRAQARSQAHLSSLCTYQYLLQWLKRSCQSSRARSLEGRTQARTLLTKASLCITQNINSVRSWVSHLVILICLWTLKRQNWKIYGVIEDDQSALSNLQLADEHQPQIPTTEIQGVLNTATLHKAYYILLSSSLNFCQMEPAIRIAIIFRIAHDIISYDNAMGYIWSPTNTFVLAAQIIQFHLNADWFDRSIQLQLADTGIKLGGDDTDVTAAFISIVFLISCGSPALEGFELGATDLAKEPRNTSRKAMFGVSDPAVSSPLPTSWRTRHTLLPGYSRQWHAMNRE
jgi:hypothetical protein